MFVNDVLERVGLSMLHVPVSYEYDVEELSAQIEEKTKVLVT